MATQEDPPRSPGPTRKPSTTSSTAFVSQLPLPGHLLLAVVVRLAVFNFTSLPELLMDRLELGTPLTAFRRLREGVFLESKDLDPYSGGTFNHSPLHLLLFSTLIPPTSRLLTSLAWTAFDVASAWALSRIWEVRVKEGRESGEERKGWEGVVAFLYLWNPYTLLTCFARSTTSLDNLLVILSIYFGASHQSLPSLAFLSLATLSSFYPLLLLPLLILLILQPPTSTSTSQNASSSSSPEPPLVQSKTKASKLIGIYFIMLGSLLVGARLMLGGWEGVFKGWKVILGIVDLTPNVGLSWYFFTEMFDHFRPFFTMVFQMHMVIYVVPLGLTFRRDPLYALLCLLSITSTLKSYPTLGDVSLSLALLPLFPSIIPYLRHPLPSLTLHLYSLILLPLLHHLWLGAGSGNANFFYASTLVFGLGCALFGVDLVVAGRLKGFDLARARRSVEEKEAREGRVGAGEGEEKAEPKWEVVQVAG
ncbi:GPI transamidase subunit PIG-U [Mrakia frigida]|uniref:GPI-anchor transamidase subunit GAB1 n=1 Tax=Mrakia frigida TaxID=29902 RepID=UPI003FCC1713